MNIYKFIRGNTQHVVVAKNIEDASRYVLDGYEFWHPDNSRVDIDDTLIMRYHVNFYSHGGTYPGLEFNVYEKELKEGFISWHNLAR